MRDAGDRDHRSRRRAAGGRGDGDGVVDFIEKPFDDDVILAAVRSALSRQTRRQTASRASAEIVERLASLSMRERQVLEGLVAGQANKRIAFELGISPRTVEVYRANLMTKMHAASLSELVRMALIAEISGSGAKLGSTRKS